MKRLTLFLLILFISCNSSELIKEFKCKSYPFLNLEKTTDIRNLFSVKLPKHWKTNLYFDNSQTSIYSADTTKSLTQSILIDITYIHNTLNFDKDFVAKLITKEKDLHLKNVRAKKIKFLDKPTYIYRSKGKKGKYTYQILNLYSKINSDNFLHSKIEIYGDSLVKQRLCKAVALIKKIELK